MEFRQLGNSGLFVPPLCFGTGTFAGAGGVFESWGNTLVDEARKLVDICLDAGINMFDTADIYSEGRSEEVLGAAIKGHDRSGLIISTKAGFPFGQGFNNQGASRNHLIQQVEGSLRRLQTDYIDVFHIHGFDGNTPVDETLNVLDGLVRAGKVRYIAASNFSGWHLMKSLAVSEKYGWARYVGHQVYYSLLNRELEWELMPLALDQQVGSIIWSPLAGGRLGGRYGRTKPLPTDGRVANGGSPVPGSQVRHDALFAVTDALEQMAMETGKTMAQVAINWLLQRPTVATVVFGARNGQQLRENMGALGWNLTAAQVKWLDEASEVAPIYPYWHQRQNTRLNPPPKFY